MSPKELALDAIMLAGLVLIAVGLYLLAPPLVLVYLGAVMVKVTR